MKETIAYKKLMMSIVIQSLIDYRQAIKYERRGFITYYGVTGRYLIVGNEKKIAINWIESKNEVFMLICNVIEIDPDMLRKRLLAIINKLDTTNDININYKQFFKTL